MARRFPVTVHVSGSLSPEHIVNHKTCTAQYFTTVLHLSSYDEAECQFDLFGFISEIRSVPFFHIRILVTLLNKTPDPTIANNVFLCKFMGNGNKHEKQAPTQRVVETESDNAELRA